MNIVVFVRLTMSFMGLLSTYYTRFLICGCSLRLLCYFPCSLSSYWYHITTDRDAVNGNFVAIYVEDAVQCISNILIN